MEFKLLELGGYTDAIARLRMSTGEYYSWEKIQEIQKLVDICTDYRGFITNKYAYDSRLSAIMIEEDEDFGKTIPDKKKITADYDKDVEEFKRLLNLTFKQAMKDNKHHTLMKGIDITFITEGLHRGGQDDLDAHAIAFNNRITRFSTRLAEIDDTSVSEWYEDKLIPFPDTPFYSDLPERLIDADGDFILTPFGYVHEKYAQVPAKNGLAKDVQRGGMPLGMPSNAIWKIDLFNLRYVYKMRSKLTKANPELKEGMEQLADQIEKHLPVFGEYFRYDFTDSGEWEHMNKVKTVTREEFEKLKKIKKWEGACE